MGEILVKEKQIVIPGEKIASGMDFIPSTGTFREGEDIYASKLGIVEIKNRVIKLIPLAGKYSPMKNDHVIGIVRDVGFSGWSVDIGAAAPANLPVGEAVKERVDLLKSDISKYYDIGDIIYTRILNVTKSRIVQLSMNGPGLKKLRGGRVIKISPSKVPRVIGKKGSMVTMLKKYTKCNIIVGQNGYIWISGPAEGQYLLEKVIKEIEEKAHISGLTDMIQKTLERGVKNA